ncbi:hypothetical protein VPH35_054457 [Triticum aestivum]
MSSCVSTTRRRRRPKDLSATATKFRWKVSTAIDGDMVGRIAGCHGVVHVDNAMASVTPNFCFVFAVICDEAWYNSISMLGDSAGSDDNDNEYSNVSHGPLLEDVTGGTNAAPCKDAVCLVDTSMASCSPRPFLGSIPSYKVQPMPVVGFSLHHKRKKAAIVRLSFGWRSYKGNVMTKMTGSVKYLYRPRAGMTLPYSVNEKPLAGCWSILQPSVFRVRGGKASSICLTEPFEIDRRYKRKSPSPNCSPYTPIGADMFACARKVHHTALPSLKPHGSFPSLLIVNIRVPTYPTTMFCENEGDGVSLVLYFKIFDNFDNVMNEEMEKVKGFPVDSNVPYTERLKILTGIVNPEDPQISATERRLVLQGGSNYFEIDIDVHQFSYISRKGLETFRERLKHGFYFLERSNAQQSPQRTQYCVHKLDYNYLIDLVCHLVFI